MGKNLKCNLSLGRQEKVFRYFDGDYGFCLDLAEETQMKTMMPQYLFYDSSWTGNNIRECQCTSCGGFTFHRSADIADFFKQLLHSAARAFFKSIAHKVHTYDKHADACKQNQNTC